MSRFGRYWIVAVVLVFFATGVSVWLYPDLPERIKRGTAYNKAIAKRFYGGGPDGYNDYLALEQAFEQQNGARP